MNLYSAFSIDPNALYKQVDYGWDQTSVYTGAIGSRYQSISDLTQHNNSQQHNEQRPDHNTGNSAPYSFR